MNTEIVGNSAPGADIAVTSTNIAALIAYIVASNSECLMFHNVLQVFHDTLLVVHDVLRVSQCFKSLL